MNEPENPPLRCFLAFDIDPKFKHLMRELQNTLKKLPGRVKWTNPADAHMTLKFLGNITSAQLDPIEQVIKQSVEKTSPIHSGPTRLGAFPDLKHPRIIWVGLDDRQEKIKLMAHRIEEGLSRIGFPAEDRSFHAHITVGRIKSSRHLSQLIQTLQNYPPLPSIGQVFDKVVLYKSTLSSQGPVYDPLRTIKME